MSDSRRRYDAVKTRVRQLFPEIWSENTAWLNNLSLIVSAIPKAKDLTQSGIAAEMPLAAQDTSLCQRQRRWLMDEDMKIQACYDPIIQPFVQAMGRATLPIILDTTAAGANCHLLTAALGYHQRALPVAWRAGKGRRGHTSSQFQVGLLEHVYQVCPDDSDVVVLGDGEFSSTDTLQWLDEHTWPYALRCARDTMIYYEHEWRRLDSFDVRSGETIWLEEVSLTQTAAYGPVNIFLTWDDNNDRLLAIVTNLPLAEEVRYWYEKRFWTEPFYGDLKGHGFDLQTSRLPHPERVARLMLAVALAYTWLVFLGGLALASGCAKFVDRTDRRDRSIFTIGRQWLNRLLKLDKFILVRFRPLTCLVHVG